MPRRRSRAKNFGVVWRARALADIGRIVRYIGTDNPIAARRIGRELLLAGDSLLTFPRRGRPGRQTGTRNLLALPPHILVYRIATDGAVTIVRIWHAAQDHPGLP